MIENYQRYQDQIAELLQGKMANDKVRLTITDEPWRKLTVEKFENTVTVILGARKDCDQIEFEDMPEWKLIYKIKHLDQLIPVIFRAGSKDEKTYNVQNDEDLVTYMADRANRIHNEIRNGNYLDLAKSGKKELHRVMCNLSTGDFYLKKFNTISPEEFKRIPDKYKKNFRKITVEWSEKVADVLESLKTVADDHYEARANVFLKDGMEIHKGDKLTEKEFAKIPGDKQFKFRFVNGLRTIGA